MPIRREVKMGGARFGRMPAERKVLTPKQREEGVLNALRVALRKMARHIGVPQDQINTKVTRLLARIREEIRNELRS